MKKYLVLIKNQVSLVTAYRFELFIGWIYRLFSFVVLFTIWNLSSGNESESNRFFGYYALLILIIDPLSTLRVAKEMSKLIQNGTFSDFLVKPISFPLTQLTKLATQFIIRGLIPIILLFIGAFIVPEKLAPYDFASFLIFLLFFTLGLILYQSLVLILGALSFWINEIGFTLTVTDLLLNLIKGTLIPLYLFSDSLKNFLSFTPIPYLAAYQIDIYQNGLDSTAPKALLVISIWLIIFTIIFKVIYKRGTARFEANGS